MCLSLTSRKYAENGANIGIFEKKLPQSDFMIILRKIRHRYASVSVSVYIIINMQKMVLTLGFSEKSYLRFHENFEEDTS